MHTTLSFIGLLMMILSTHLWRSVSSCQNGRALHRRILPSLMASYSTQSTSDASSNSNSSFYTIGLTGSSGLVGTALRDELRRVSQINGKPIRVVRLVRGPQAQAWTEPDAAEVELQWNPHGSSTDEVLHPTAVATLDAVVHLSGENVATGLGMFGVLGLRPWTDAKKREIVESRTVTSRALAQAIASCEKPKSFLVASGVGVYGNEFVGDAKPAADESTNVESTPGFLAHVSREWEKASQMGTASQHRVVNMRFGVVQSLKGGALAKLFPIFWLGGGGIVGSGEQYLSFSSARDHARAMVHTLQTPSLKGPVNICAPEPCTNAEFTRALGSSLNRPTILPLPGFAVNLLFGEMGQEMLLGGVRAKPTKLLKSGFEFEHPTIELAIQSALKENI